MESLEKSGIMVYNEHVKHFTAQSSLCANLYKKENKNGSGKIRYYRYR